MGSTKASACLVEAFFINPPQTPPLIVRDATEQRRTVLEQLWTMFRHDMSASRTHYPTNKAASATNVLRPGLTQPGWSAHLFWLGSSPVGLAVLRGLDTEVKTISSFFVVNAARRCGIGREAVRQLTTPHPGRWSVAFQDANTVAAHFWRSVAVAANDTWVMEHHQVPGRPDLPSDAWVQFNVR